VSTPRFCRDQMPIKSKVLRRSHIAHGVLGTLGILSSASILHEAGHLAVAKLCGSKVDSISFGAGPVIAGFFDGETPVALHLVPFGCRVQMSEDHQSDPPLHRILVSLGGPATNLLVATTLSLIFLATHDHIQVGEGFTVRRVVAGTDASAVGIVEGDHIISINGMSLPPSEETYRNVEQSLMTAPSVSFNIQRGDHIYEADIIPKYGRLGIELSPFETTREVTDIGQIPGLIFDDIKTTLTSTLIEARNIVTFSHQPIPVRPLEMLQSPLFEIELINLNIMLVTLLCPPLDGWNACVALKDLIFGLLLKSFM
jgi:membrane-associated protease RseP (regulator of RpoE activity)